MGASTRTVFVLAAAFMLCCSAASATRAQVSGGNLLMNGDFDADLSGWTTPGTPGLSFARSPLDAIDRLSSGSGFVSNGDYGTTRLVARSACLSASAGVAHDVAVHIAIPAGQKPVDGSCEMRVDWFGLDCVDALYLTSTYVASAESVIHDLGNVWQLFTTRVTAPNAGDLKAQVVLHSTVVDTYPGAPDFVCYFDELILAPVGGATIPLFGNGFESVFGWSDQVP